MWYDNRADDLTKEGMLKGIEQAAAFILVSGLLSVLISNLPFDFLLNFQPQFLSTGVLTRPYCQLEIRHAVALKKPIVLIHGRMREKHA